MSNEDRLFGQILDALRQSEARYRHLIEHTTDIIFTMTVDGHLIMVNKAAEDLFGQPREWFIGRDVMDFVAPEHRELVQDMISRKVSGAEASTFYTINVFDRNRQRVPLELSTQVIYDGGMPLAIQGIGRDIRQRLHPPGPEDQERFYRIITEQSSDILMVADATPIIRYVSPSFQSTLGYPVSEIIGTSGFQFLHPEDVPRAQAAFRQVAENADNVPLELRVRAASGEYHFFDIRLNNMLHDPVIRGVVLDCRDVTEHKNAEMALRRSEHRFRKLIETSGEGIAMRDPQGNISFANERFAEILGYSVDEILGWPIEKIVAPPSHGILRESFERRRRTGRAESLDLQLLHRDGRYIDVILAATPMYDEEGQFIGSLGMVTDITERKRLEMQLRQSQKMEAVGRLAGGIAHDFNNLLTAIRGHVDLMLAELPPDSALRADCREIAHAADRAASLTQQLLAFSRKQMLQPVVLEVDDVVRNLETLMRRLIGADIDMQIDLCATGKHVKADRTQLEQVLMNLVVNARDAMPTGGTLRITTDTFVADEAFLREQPGAAKGTYVKLSVSDTGSGMDPQTLARVFEPFFTTKAVGKGTGLGLATVYGIVQQSEGFIRAFSEKGKGSRFDVYLPLVEETVQHRGETKPAGANGAHGETILVAEDEDAVRALTCRILRKRGYTVLEARDGREALDIAAEFEGRIDLVVTDVIMPRLGGRELSEGLARMMPSVKVLFMSGYTDDQLLQRGVLQSSIRNFLEKPFTPETLARKVREVLEGN